MKKNGGEERNYEVEKVGGRKLKVKKEEEEIVSTCSTKKSSGANYVGKREMKMEKMMSSSVINHHHHQHHDQTKNINPSGFMALNADYHMARPHPPRNN